MATAKDIKRLFNREGFPITNTQALRILKASTAVLHHNEMECDEPNEALREQARKRAEQHIKLLKRTFKEVREAYPKTPDLTFTVNGDPRGYPIKYHFPSGIYNTWGGQEDGFGIHKSMEVTW